MNLPIFSLVTFMSSKAVSECVNIKPCSYSNVKPLELKFHTTFHNNLCYRLRKEGTKIHPPLTECQFYVSQCYFDVTVLSSDYEQKGGKIHSKISVILFISVNIILISLFYFLSNFINENGVKTNPTINIILILMDIFPQTL